MKKRMIPIFLPAVCLALALAGGCASADTLGGFLGAFCGRKFMQFHVRTSLRFRDLYKMGDLSDLALCLRVVGLYGRIPDFLKTECAGGGNLVFFAADQAFFQRNRNVCYNCPSLL